MEAPENFYVSTDPFGCLHAYDCENHPPIVEEYYQKDAFIEKACEWLRTHSEADYFELIPDANYCGTGNLNKKRMIEDFKNYMKGE